MKKSGAFFYKLDYWDIALLALGVGAGLAGQGLWEFGADWLIAMVLAPPALRRLVVREPERLMYERPTVVSGSLLRLVLVGLGVVLTLLGAGIMFVMVQLIGQTNAGVEYALFPAALIAAGVGCLIWAQRISRKQK